MNTEQKLTYSSKSLDHTLDLGLKLAKLCSPPFLIELVGDLGGGKTVLVKAIGKGLGITRTITSPSYNIHLSYEAPNGTKLEHFDLYRLNDDEIVQNELIDALADDKAIVCVEWAQHFAGHSSDNRLTIECHYVGPSSRRYEISGFGKAGQAIILGLKQ